MGYKQIMKTFILSVLVISICVYSFSECSCPVCTIIDNFRNLLRYNSALHSTYKVFTDFGLLRCVQQCMFRTRCQSINFELSTQTCELNQDTSSGPSFRNGSVFTPIIIWPKRLARLCEINNCALHSVCVIDKHDDRFTTSCVNDEISPVDKGYTKAPALPFYYKYYTTRQSYLNARNTCQNEGAQLLEPDTEEKNDVIRRVLQDQGSKFVYIGARDFEDTGDWRWESSNASLTFNHWDPTEPQTGKNEHCAGYYKPYRWKWVNFPCDWEEEFVCEITFT